ncbi:hypothetical protein, partial [Nitrososphaera sp.]|uniref:hypothetical protein n=1 Tax=Nitrososphaera sp. TaxID=1971748 RepID=UPI002ED96158
MSINLLGESGQIDQYEYAFTGSVTITLVESDTDDGGSGGSGGTTGDDSDTPSGDDSDTPSGDDSDTPSGDDSDTPSGDDSYVSGEGSFVATGSHEGIEYEVRGKSAGGVFKATEVILNLAKSVQVTFDVTAESTGDEREVWLSFPKAMIDGIYMVQSPESSPLHAGESVSYEVVDETFGDNAQTTIRFVIPEGTDTVEVLGTTV